MGNLQGSIEVPWPKAIFIVAWGRIEPMNERRWTVLRGTDYLSVPHKRHYGTFVFLLIVVFGVCPVDAQSTRPWWTNYHTVLSHPRTKLKQSWELGAMAERSLWATGWYGPWWIQNQLQDRGGGNARVWIERGRAQGLKNVFYYDAGEFGQFVALVRDRQIVLNQWQLCFYRGAAGRLMWFGKNGFYRDANPLDLKNYREFKLPAWTRPDGTRVRSVFDLARMSFDGKRDAWDYSHVSPSDDIAKQLKLDEFLRKSPDPVPESVGRSLGRICSYDHSNPFLLRDFEAGVGMMLTLKPAYLHFDNYFDNETLYPAKQAFGAWSLEKFRRFVRTHLDRATCDRIGIGAPDKFDLKQYIAGKPFRSRGLNWHLHNSKWHDDPIWNLFICSKYADSDRLFRDLYAFCKEESSRHGRPVVVVGNCNPLFPGRSLTRGAIDMAHFEHHAAVQFGPIVEPTGLPPRGRFGGIVRLGAAVSAAGYCWPTIYVPRKLSGEKHPNLHKVMAMDCLANKGVLDYNYQYRNGYTPGCDASAAWADCFIKTFSSYYGDRTSRNDVGVIYPGQTQLASISVFTMDPEICLYDYLGWTQALTELHIQWDVVPDDQISEERLRAFRAVVLPSVACLSDHATDILRKYANSGGHIVLSGNVGTRYGLERYLWHREEGVSLNRRMRGSPTRVGANQQVAAAPNVVVCPETPGKQFYMDAASGRRQAGKPAMLKAIDTCLAKRSRILETDAPSTVGCFVYNESQHAIAIDLVNYDLDTPTDALTPATATTLTLHAPRGKRFSAARVTLHDPDWRTAAQLADSAQPLTPWEYPSRTVHGTLHDDGSITITIPPFSVYRRVSIALQDNTTAGAARHLPAVTEKHTTGAQGRADVIAPPKTEVTRLELPSFYRKYIAVDGFPIVASAQVSNYALREAAFLVRHLLAHRPDVLKALVRAKVRLVVMGYNQWTTDIPEHAHLRPKDYWDRRARGLGATLEAPTVSCAEENLLSYPGDPYSTENIMIHEFGHTIHLVGLRLADPTFDDRLRQAYEQARKAGLWDGTYAGTNRQEYWAEGVQSWFDTNRQNDAQHNQVNTRAELKSYDPGLAKLLKEVFGDEPWRYTPPKTRWDQGHLAGFDPATAPRFQWPDRLKNVQVDHPAAGATKNEVRRSKRR